MNNDTCSSICTTVLLTLLLGTSVAYAEKEKELEVIAPPAIGEKTKGEPAIDETNINSHQGTTEPSYDNNAESSTQSRGGLFSENTTTVYRRESGQVYRIELNSALGGKQIIEETDSNGKIESSTTDLEDTPNIPKWKLGSW